MEALGNIPKYKPRVTLFELWPREADNVLFRRAVHFQLSTRPWAGVDGVRICARCGWLVSDETKRLATDNGKIGLIAAISQPTGALVAFAPVLGTAGENSPRLFKPLCGVCSTFGMT